MPVSKFCLPPNVKLVGTSTWRLLVHVGRSLTSYLAPRYDESPQLTRFMEQTRTVLGYCILPRTWSATVLLRPVFHHHSLLHLRLVGVHFPLYNGSTSAHDSQMGKPVRSQPGSSVGFSRTRTGNSSTETHRTFQQYRVASTVSQGTRGCSQSRLRARCLRRSAISKLLHRFILQLASGDTRSVFFAFSHFAGRSRAAFLVRISSALRRWFGTSRNGPNFTRRQFSRSVSSIGRQIAPSVM